MGSVQAGGRLNSRVGLGVSRRVADKALAETDSNLRLPRAACTPVLGSLLGSILQQASADFLLAV